MRRSFRSLAALSLLTLGACGSGAATDAGAAPESVPFASTSTSAAPATVPSTAAPSAAPVPVGDPAASADPTSADPTAADPAASGDEVSAAMITSLLSTDDGRTMVAEMMAQETGITQDQALCFLQNIDAETMVSLSELGTSGATPDPSTLPPGVLDDLMGAVSTCGIAPDTILG